VLDANQAVTEIQVKQPDPTSHWIWGAFKMPGAVFTALRALWQARDCGDEYFGTLVNAYIAGGGQAIGIKAGENYADVGTVDGYRAAMNLLAQRTDPREADASAVATPQDNREESRGYATDIAR
jgi:glucose-1-phosphate thymidylyltransferase